MPVEAVAGVADDDGDGEVVAVVAVAVADGAGMRRQLVM